MVCKRKKNVPEVVIYHNARCSKSRSACEIVAAKGIEARIVEYLKTPPDREALRDLLKKLGMKPSELVRRGEDAFKQNFAGKTLDEEEWLDALLAYPILIERPIVVRGKRAVIGRPPEKVLELLDGDA
ncbi:MAG: arsenate reductase (glutaredoxin) [Candidatus Accumulibacter sp.]|jgi:arsenate reductase|nr:arsenate reductase (glutaredoxin) [Accumulibacter sp.]